MIDRDVKEVDIVRALDGVSQQTISRHINAKGRNPKIQQAIADYLGVLLDEILDKDERAETDHAA